MPKTTSCPLNRRILIVNITPGGGQFLKTNEISLIFNSPFADIEELLVVVDRGRSSASRAPSMLEGKSSTAKQIDVDPDAVANYDRNRTRSLESRSI
jgi:hypothetical protein